MSAARERELKLRILSRAGHLELRDGPDWGERSEPELQVNHYFDTACRRLLHARILLRIREGGGRCILTVKRGREVRPGFFDSVEVECEVDRTILDAALERPGSLADLRLPPIDEIRGEIAGRTLELSGRLENERVKRRVRGLVLEVDRLVFPDGAEDFELEVETDDPRAAGAWLEEELARRGIPFEPSRLTKAERLLEWERARGGVSP